MSQSSTVNLISSLTLVGSSSAHLLYPIWWIHAIKHNYGIVTYMQFQMIEVSDGASWEIVDDNEIDLVNDYAQVFSTASL
jgi:hypothetical protein